MADSRYRIERRSAVVGAVALLFAVPTARSQDRIAESIEVGQLLSGVLSNDDPPGPYRSNHADRYSFPGFAGQRVEILMTSDVLDTYVILQDTAGVRLVEDDDGAGNLDSRVLVTLPMDGLYTVLATSYSRQEGPYELLVREFRPRAVIFESLVPGRPTHGTLDDADASRSDNRRIDGYHFEGQTGDQVRIGLASAAFDTSVYLLGPTGELLAENDDAASGNSDSEVALRLPADGEYRVIVTSFGEALGDYVLELTRLTFAPIEDRSMTLGEPVSGRLEPGDGTWSSRGAYADGYTFEGERGEHVDVTMTSTEVDAYLVLLGPDGTVLAEGDDSGESLDARVSARLAVEGTYRLLATSFSLAEGSYLLRSEALELRPLERQRLRLGRRVEAELTADDPLRQLDPAHMDLYELELDLGQRVVITMRSAAFNSFLWVVGPTGEVLREDDDSGGGLDALIEVNARYRGTYLVVATTYAGLTGPYTLDAEDASDRAEADWVGLSLGQTLEGRLEYGDGVTPTSGSYRDRYRFEAAAGDQVEIRLDSLEVDPYLALVGPNGLVLAEDDDGGGGLNSLIQTILPDEGEYRLFVTSYSHGIGAYELSLRRFAPTQVQPLVISVGDRVSGELVRSDARSARYGTLVDVFRLDGEQGQTLCVEMSSARLDPFLLIIDPNGEVLAEDDDGGGGLNARLALTLPMTGPYRLLATSASYGEGEYELVVSPLEASPSASPFQSP